MNDSEMNVYSAHYWMFAIQILGIASMFCIMFAYKKLLQNFRLSTELSLLEQEEHSLNQYVEGMTGELSFPCSTNNPVVDILVGNKMGIAKSMEIDRAVSREQMLDRGIDDMEAGRELPLDEAFQKIMELRDKRRNARA